MLRNFCLAIFSLLIIHCSLFSVALASGKWQGVDESVVEKVAKEHGREAKTPLINTDQGDLLLFVFLLAGVIGGFIAGYYWRVLMDSRREGAETDFSASPRGNSENGPARTTGRNG
jgi:ABC-type cobalt transport system substrate-binding protein